MSRRWIEISAVWIVALVGGVIALLVLPAEHHLRGVSVVLAGCVLLTFAVQLADPRQVGFVSRLTASVVGAFGVLLIVSLGALTFG